MTRRTPLQPVRAIEIDLTDVDTQVALAGIVLGVIFGLGAPYWYITRVEKDAERLEEIRVMNRECWCKIRVSPQLKLSRLHRLCLLA